MRRLLLISVITLIAIAARGQIISPSPSEVIDTDSVRKAFDNSPFFGLYKDNYFIFGPSVGPKATKANTNVKFQISIAQRLTKSVLPWHTYLYLFYTQKCFWNVLQKSFPMTDLNFNPGIGITKPLFVKNRYIGKMTFLVEHESNGRDSIQSRSWNRVALAANVFVTKNLMVHAKVWVPIVDGENNLDIVDYCGWNQFGIQVVSDNKRFTGGISIVPRHRIGSCNVVVDFAVRLFKRENQYLFFQFYNGYGEGLLDYNKFHSQLRVGLLIRPKLFSDF